ncbi:MAG: DMT family transporter [Sedimentisphaerales bacterium]|jgi:drug/metabolite transporter (DMT)-like permease
MEKTNRKINFAGTAFAVLSLLCGVPGPLIIKYIAPDMDFWTQNFLRYVVAVITMLPFIFLSQKKDFYSKELWRKALIIAVINVVVQCCWGAAFYYINPAFVTLLSKSSILWTVAISLIFFADERPLVKSWAFWASFIIVIVGLAGVMVFKQDFSTKASIIGIVLTLGFAISWAFYTISIKVLLKNEDSITSFTIVSIYSTIGLGILAFWFGKPMQCVNFSGNIWFLLILSSLTSISASHVTFYSAIKRIGSSIPTLVVLAQPFLVLLVSRVLFDEHLNGPQWFFGLLLIAGAGLAIKAQEHIKN